MLEYLCKGRRPIESVDIYPGDAITDEIMGDLKIEMRVREEDLGYFDIAYWKKSGLTIREHGNGQRVSVLRLPVCRT